jgi:hypothetical protein
MDLQFPFVNVATGETGVPAYVDAEQIMVWYQWIIPDDLGQGVSRKLRGKTLVVLVTKSGSQHWTDDSFDSVSARILEAKGQKDRAQLHAAAHAAELLKKKSPLAVV